MSLHEKELLLLFSKKTQLILEICPIKTQTFNTVKYISERLILRYPLQR